MPCTPSPQFQFAIWWVEGSPTRLDPTALRDYETSAIRSVESGFASCVRPLAAHRGVARTAAASEIVHPPRWEKRGSQGAR